MAYTNVWTTAAPLDTQAANQGAVDFRATKLDVMQRIASFGAGLLAARPTPEATSASADWTGVMYWATDTKQTFRWNGASWDDISTSLPIITPVLPQVVPKRFSNVTPVTVTDDGAAHNGQLIVLPANAMTQFGIAMISGRAVIASGQTNPFSKIALYFGATLISEFRSDLLAPGSFGFNESINFTAVITGVGISTQGAIGTSQLGQEGVGGGGFTYGTFSNPGEAISGAITVKTADEGGVASTSQITFDNLSVVIF